MAAFAAAFPQPIQTHAFLVTYLFSTLIFSREMYSRIGRE